MNIKALAMSKNLKWNNSDRFSFQNLDCNWYIFQKITIYNDELQINGTVTCRNLKNKSSQNIKRLPHSFYFQKVRCIKINPDRLFSYLYNNIEDETKQLFTKYTDTLTFNFTLTINDNWCIMPLQYRTNVVQN